jgi:outer membrane protein TolC
MSSVLRSAGWSVLFLLLLCTGTFAQDSPLSLQRLIDEALKNNPEIQAADAKASAMSERISQMGSLPDPIFSAGYQNEGLRDYSYGTQDSWWTVSLSQTFAYPGKLPLQEEAASFEVRAERANAELVKHQVVGRVSEGYYDLFLATKELVLIQARKPLASRLEEASLARYASGVGSQVEVIMAQAEKYMLIEKEEMAKRKIASFEAMLNREIGRDTTAPFDRIEDTPPTPFNHPLDETLERARSHSPELIMQENLIRASEKKSLRSRKEAYPDITLMGSYFNRGNGMDDMYALTASIPLPIFYKRKQGAGINEAAWNLASARRNLDTARLRIESEVRDNFAMIRASDRVMELYKDALIPNARKDIDAALAQYSSGRIDAATTLAKLKAPFDYELTLWQQFVEREKAIARIHVITGDLEAGK